MNAIALRVLLILYALIFIFGQNWLMSYFSIGDDRIIEVGILFLAIVTWYFLRKSDNNK